MPHNVFSRHLIFVVIPYMYLQAHTLGVLFTCDITALHHGKIDMRYKHANTFICLLEIVVVDLIPAHVSWPYTDFLFGSECYINL